MCKATLYKLEVGPCAVTSAYVLAGTCLGIAEGCLRAITGRGLAAQTVVDSAASHVTFRKEEAGDGTCQPASVQDEGTLQHWTSLAQPCKSLLNVVLMGDRGAGQAAALQVYAHGLQSSIHHTNHHAHCELELVEATVVDQHVTLAVWCLGGRDAAGIGGSFFMSASCFVVFYDPRQSPWLSLDFWSRVCRGGASSEQPMLVVACCPSGSGEQEQVHNSLATLWCTSRENTQHMILASLESREAVQPVFQKAAELALGHQRQQSERTVAERPTRLPSQGQEACTTLKLKLPTLMETELGFALEALTACRSSV